MSNIFPNTKKNYLATIKMPQIYFNSISIWSEFVNMKSQIIILAGAFALLAVIYEQKLVCDSRYNFK